MEDLTDAVNALVARIDALLAHLERPSAGARPVWMTPAETCRYFRWIYEVDGAGHRAGEPNLDLFYTARKRYGLPARKVGGSLRCHRMYVDEWARTGVAVPDPVRRRRS